MNVSMRKDCHGAELFLLHSIGISPSKLYRLSRTGHDTVGSWLLKLSLDESPTPKRTVHFDAMFFEEPGSGACGTPSTSALGLVCQMRSGPDYQIAF